jgi:hypothetical protein
VPGFEVKWDVLVKKMSWNYSSPNESNIGKAMMK